MANNGLVSLTAIEWSAAAQELVRSYNAEEISELETLLGCTRDEAVSHFVEESCCSDDLPDFVGGKGTPEDRRYALLALWKDYAGEKHHA